MMREVYESPEMEIIELDQDIITTSTPDELEPTEP